MADDAKEPTKVELARRWADAQDEAQKAAAKLRDATLDLVKAVGQRKRLSIPVERDGGQLMVVVNPAGKPPVQSTPVEPIE